MLRSQDLDNNCMSAEHEVSAVDHKVLHYM